MLTNFEASGRNTFRAFTFLTFLTAIGGVVAEYLFAGVWCLDGVYISIVALLSFIIEVCLRKYPDDTDRSDEIESDSLLGGRYVGGVEFVPPVEQEKAKT